MRVTRPTTVVASSALWAAGITLFLVVGSGLLLIATEEKGANEHAALSPTSTEVLANVAYSVVTFGVIFLVLMALRRKR